MPIQWKAVYDDNSYLNQEGNKYTDIDRSKICFFELYRDNKLVLRLHLDENKKLIYRKRVAMSMFTKKTEEVHLVGWQQKVKGENIQSISYIFEDGHIEMAGQFRENTQWFYSVKFLSEEC